MKNYPVNQPLIDGNEKEYLIDCIESGWISSDGPFVEQFESLFSNFVDCNYGVSVCNGTAALETALYAVGIEKGDEIIMPSFTIISCAIAALRLNAVPVLVDVKQNWNMDVSQIEKKITNKTKAIMAVHMYGHPAEMNTIKKIADKYNLYVVEDASQVHGAKYNGKSCGSIGDIATFSFYANKIITTGEGGMVTTSNKAFFERAKSYRNLCFKKERRFYHDELGENFRMTNMQAALGVAQMERVNEFIEKKIHIGRKYAECLSSIPNIRIQQQSKGSKMVYWMYCVELDEKHNKKASIVIEELGKNGIGTRPFFLGLHQQPVLINKGLFSNEDYPITEKASEYGFYLPSSLSLKDKDVEYIVNELKKILGS